MFNNLNQFINLYLECFKQFGRGKIWLILLGYASLNGLVLYAHYDFLSPLFYPLISSWTALVSEPGAKVFTHYPGHFLSLPYFYGLATLVPGLLFEGLVLGWAALKFREAFLRAHGAEIPTSRPILSSWFSLSLAWAVLKGLTILASLYLLDIFAFYHQESPRRLLSMDLVVVPFFLTFILALFYYAVSTVALYGCGFGQGLKHSLGIFIRRPLTSFFLAAFTLAGPYLLSVAAGKSADIVSKFKPELVLWLLVVALGVELIANFFWVGTSVRFLLEEDSG